MLCCTVLYCDVLCLVCCAVHVLHRAVMCSAVLCCAVLHCAVLCCAALCCAVLCCDVLCFGFHIQCVQLCKCNGVDKPKLE